MSTSIYNPILVESDFSRGVVRDVARLAIPPGGVYEAVDYLFDQPGVVYKRGGSVFQSSEATEELVLVAVAAPEYPGDPRVWVIGSDGGNRTLYDATGDTLETGVSCNDAQPTENPPALWINATVGLASILCDGLGDGSGNYADVQKVYLDGSDIDVSDLDGTPPNARCSCAHLSYLVLANGFDPNDSDAYHPNRLWFSPVPDIEGTWDTTLAYIDVDFPITGLASVSGVLLVFSRGRTWRILGNVPPGTDGENMEIQPVGSVGCIDARSIVSMNGLVYFADESGVYYSNGAGYGSITEKPDSTGISTLWAQAVAGYSPGLGSVVCAGTWLNAFLFVTVLHSADDPQEGAAYIFLYHQPTQSWTRLSHGVVADMYATRFAPDGEIYAAIGDGDVPVQLVRLSPLFTPNEDNDSDASGAAIEPILTTRPLSSPPGLKAFGHGWLEYDLRSEGSPEMKVLLAPSVKPPDNGNVHATYEATTAPDRRRFAVNFDSQAASITLQQIGNSASTDIYSLQCEVRPYDIPSEGE